MYVLPSDDVYEQDRIVFLGEKVLDDKSMPGKTLGVRRLQSGRKDLVKLKGVIFDLPEFIKSKYKFFADVNGRVFTYEKTQRLRLRCYRVNRIERKEVASLLWLFDCATPFTLRRPPTVNVPFARVLEYGDAPWLLYDYVREPTPLTYRRV